jgi:hypothetical protein
MGVLILLGACEQGLAVVRTKPNTPASCTESSGTPLESMGKKRQLKPADFFPQSSIKPAPGGLSARPSCSLCINLGGITYLTGSNDGYWTYSGLAEVPDYPTP